MTATITATATDETVNPDLILGYITYRNSRNVVHDLLDGGIGVVFTAPRPRSGTLELLFEDETAAFEALALHEQESTFVLSSTERDVVDMTYVLGEGQLGLSLDDQTRTAWVLSVPYQEVIA